MEFKEFEALFIQSMQQNGLDAPAPQTTEAFYRFDQHLHTVNSHTNLTAIRSSEEAISKHYVDSLLISQMIPPGSRVLDLGCGPGFPSTPLAIYRPDLEIIALDSTAKKIAFVQSTKELLALSNLTPISGRAEDQALAKSLGQFDVVVSRAVARMNILCELCLPYLKIGGVLLAMKGAKGEEELVEAEHCIKTLGGLPGILFDGVLVIPNGSTEVRTLIKVQKEKKTPSGYPRNFSQIQKKPL